MPDPMRDLLWGREVAGASDSIYFQGSWWVGSLYDRSWKLQITVVLSDSLMSEMSREEPDNIYARASVRSGENPYVRDDGDGRTTHGWDPHRLLVEMKQWLMQEYAIYIEGEITWQP